MRQKADLIIYYNVIYNSLRMLVGAVSSIYLINHGVSVVDIGLMKSMQSIIYFLFDIPSSFWADRYSRKAAVVISTILGGLWLVVTGISNSVGMYYLAEALNALSLTIISGVIQSYIIDNSDRVEDAHKILGRVNKLQFLFMALFAILGSFLAEINDRLPWIVGGGGCLIISLTFAWFLPKPVIKSSIHNEEIGFFLSLKYFISFKNIRLEAFNLILLMVFFQILLQYWQLLINSSSEIKNDNISYGLLFSFILLSQSISGYITSISNNSNKQRFFSLFIGWIFIFILFLGVYKKNNLNVLSLIFLFGIIQNLIVFSRARFHLLVKSELRSMSESFVSTLSRLLVIFFMPFIAFISTNFSWVLFVIFLSLLFLLSTIFILKDR